jgi:hypothetical protein
MYKKQIAKNLQNSMNSYMVSGSGKTFIGGGFNFRMVKDYFNLFPVYQIFERMNEQQENDR